MPDREKVIKGLEHCSNKSFCNDSCPYSSILRDPNFGIDECMTQLAHDALELLKEQEARVMTLEEVDEHSEREEKYSESEKQPVYVEYANDVNRPWARRWLTVDMLHSWLDHWETRIVYGKDWRCWTFRPTEEQRKAAKWMSTKK